MVSGHPLLLVLHVLVVLQSIPEVQGGGWWIDVHSDEWPAIYQACRVEQACVGGCGQCKEGHYGQSASQPGRG